MGHTPPFTRASRGKILRHGLAPFDGIPIECRKPEFALSLYNTLDFHLFVIGDDTLAYCERGKTLASRMPDLTEDDAVVMLDILHHCIVINGNPFHWPPPLRAEVLDSAYAGAHC